MSKKIKIGEVTHVVPGPLAAYIEQLESENIVLKTLMWLIFAFFLLGVLVANLMQTDSKENCSCAQNEPTKEINHGTEI